MLDSHPRLRRFVSPSTEERGDDRLFALSGLQITLARDAELFAEGAPAIDAFNLVSGSLRLVKLMNDGRRHICEFVLAGEFVGLTSHDHHQFSAEAMENCVLFRYRRSGVEAHMAADPLFAGEIRRHSARGLNNAYERMVALCHRPATARVAWFLLTMAQAGGGATPAEVFRLPMSRSDIGDYLGMAIETVSRAFTALKKTGVIQEPSPSVIKCLDRAGLQKIVDGI